MKLISMSVSAILIFFGSLSFSDSAVTKLVIHLPKTIHLTTADNIQTAINNAAEGDSIVLAAGTYHQTVFIGKDDLTLQGAGSGATILDGDCGGYGCGKTVISIDAAINIAITGMTIQNGSKGIYAQNGSSVTLSNIVSQGNWGHGIDAYYNSLIIFEDTNESSNNKSIGIQVFGGSNVVFNSGSVTANSNGHRGINLDTSCSCNVGSCDLTTDSNTRDGIGIFNGSSMTCYGANTLEAKNNTERGIAVAKSSSLFAYNNSITLQNNQGIGLQISESSSADVRGTTLVDKNINNGVSVNRSSSLASSGSLTVQGTTGKGIGILISEVSTFHAWDGTLTVQNNEMNNENTDYGDGIMVVRGSNLKLKGTGINAQIIKNDGNGISVYQGASARLDVGIKVNQNNKKGIMVSEHSTLYARNIEAKSNLSWGISGEKGSSVDCKDSDISLNSSGAFYIGFASFSILSGNTVSGTAISCDPTALSSGSPGCPP